MLKLTSLNKYCTMAAPDRVVDDTHSCRFLLKNFLDDASYQVTCVASGAEALTELGVVFIFISSPVFRIKIR